MKIESESRYLWTLFVEILKLPVTFVLIFFGKRKFGDLFRPFVYSAKFAVAPKCTTLLIILNVLVFVIGLFVDLSVFVHVPSDIFSSRIFTLFTAGFLHADFSHLFANMAGIFIVGRIVEMKLGAFKTFFLYIFSLLISMLFSSLIHLWIIQDNTAGIGSSGALMGLVSVAILLDPFYITYKFFVPLPIMAIGWLAVFADISGIINPVEDGIGHFAHLGGFLSIAVIMFFLSSHDRAKLKKGLIMNFSTLLAGIIAYFVLNK